MLFRSELALKLEEIALKDDYFVQRKLYPNVDFYSGVIYSALGIPRSMFTVMFAIGRLPGWIAHWKEQNDDPSSRINRPRQIYTGATLRSFVPHAVADRVSGHGRAHAVPVAPPVHDALTPTAPLATAASEQV